MVKRATLEGRDLLFQQIKDNESKPAEAVTQESTPKSARGDDQEIQKSRKPETLEKVSFRLSPKLITRLARAKVELRERGIKVNQEQIVAQALEKMLDDLEKNREHSDLVGFFSRNQEK